ncbi:MAG: BatD family protein [bacterium]
MKIRDIKTVFISFCMLIILPCLWADDLEIRAYVNKIRVGLNQQFDLKVELSGSDYKSAGSPQLPDMNDFAHYLGSSTSQNIQFINGKMSASKTISYHYQATKVGTFTIGGITVRAGNKEYTTKPIEITVIKSAQQSAASKRNEDSAVSQTNGSLDENLFILAVPDKNTVYNNEPVIITYKIYTRVNVSSFGLEKAPSTKGFLKEDFDIGRRPQTSKEMYKDKQYTVAEIQKMSLYPLSAGRKTIDPLVVNCQVKVQRNRRDIFDDFFSDPFGRTVNKVITSNAVIINVLPLPEQGKPEGFTGIVGNFSISSDVSKKYLTTDDAVTFTVRIAGEGHIGSLSEPELNFPDVFETYDPEISKSIDRKGGRITGSKIFKYVLVPRKTGTFRIGSITYPIFNPRTKSYQILSTDPVELHISKGKGGEAAAAHSGFSKEEVDLLGKDIRFIKEGYDSLRKIQWNIFSSLLFWIIILLPLMLLVASAGYRKHLDRLHTDQAYARNRIASREAKKHLSEAKDKIKSEDQKEFYGAVNRAITGFVSDKLNISGAGMMSEDVKRRLKQKGVSDSVIEQYISTLQTCDLKRFSPSEASVKGKEHFYKKVEQTLSVLAKELS